MGLKSELTQETFSKKNKERRKPATHVPVIMLSDELRNKKPYAMPVQYIPYQTLSDVTVQRLFNKIKEVMREHDMIYMMVSLNHCRV